MKAVDSIQYGFILMMLGYHVVDPTPSRSGWIIIATGAVAILAGVVERVIEWQLRRRVR